MVGEFRAVKPMNEQEIEKTATLLRRSLGLDAAARVAMINLVETVLEEVLPGYRFTVLPDSEMPGMDGFTGVEHLEICLSESTYIALSKSDPDARHTVAHEFGHLVLHSMSATAMARRTEYDRRVDPEWQADQFADVWLMPHEGVAECHSIEEVMQKFTVPEEAAQRRFLSVWSETKGIQGDLFE